MNRETIACLDQMFFKTPIMKAIEVPSEIEIDKASRDIGIVFPQDYRYFLSRYGGGIIGAYPIYGLRPCELMESNRWSVIDVTNNMRQSQINDIFLSWIIFSEDHAGNPIGMNENDEIFIFDHDFGGVSALASSFESYVRIQCLGL